MATTKIPFRSAYSEHKEHITPAGDGKREEYAYEYNNKNQKVLTKTKEIDMYAEIQSYHESTKIENILARVAIGDMSDFRPDGIYTDATKMPNNLIDARKEIQKLENFWNMQNVDVKRQYGFSLDNFIADAGSKAWLLATGLVNPMPTEETPTAKATAPVTKPETPKEE